MNLKALTSKELESVLEAIDAVYVAADLLESAGALTDANADLDVVGIANAIIEEMTARIHETAADAYDVGELLATGTVNPFLRPDGQIGYAPVGMYEGERPTWAGCYGEGAL